MRKIILISVLVSALLFSGCAQPQNNASNSSQNTLANNSAPTADDLKNTVESGDKIKVDYRGTLQDGTEFDSSLKEGREPLEFTAGSGQMIKGFDDAVIGMKLNGEKTVALKPEDAYGMPDTEKIIEVPVKDLIDSGIEPEVGMMVNSSMGSAKIIEINGETARLDFNHPLAGKNLTFWIKVVGITKK